MRMRYFVAGTLLIVGMIAMVQAQPGFGRGGLGPMFLINNKAVQQDLKMTEDQVTKVREWQMEFFPKIGEIYKDKGIEFGKGFGKAQSEEDRAKFAEAQAEVNKLVFKELGDVLKKEQVDRLKEIDRRQMGVYAFTNAEVADALKLTDSQKTSVKGISGDFEKERREIMSEVTKDKDRKGKGGKGGFGGFGLDPETQKKISKLQSEAVGKVVDLLDDSQKKTWKELIGADFDLSKLQGGFGGFGKDGKDFRKKKDD
jgi:hypothetical protein